MTPNSNPHSIRQTIWQSIRLHYHLVVYGHLGPMFCVFSRSDVEWHLQACFMKYQQSSIADIKSKDTSVWLDILYKVKGFLCAFFKTKLHKTSHVGVGNSLHGWFVDMCSSFENTFYMHHIIWLDVYRKQATNRAHLTFIFYFLRWVPQFSNFGIWIKLMAPFISVEK